MIDTHCHLEHYRNSFEILNEIEQLKIYTIAVSMVPEGYLETRKHVEFSKYVRAALGLHPKFAVSHYSSMKLFEELVDQTTYIGEVGLDYSINNGNDRRIQKEIFERILSTIQGKNKILTIHSVQSAKDVLDLLVKYNHKKAIFHWYSGDCETLEEIIRRGYYLSINPAMIRNNNGKDIISKIPKNRVLTETDGPFVKVNNKVARPKDVEYIEAYLSKIWNLSTIEVSELIKENFTSILT